MDVARVSACAELEERVFFGFISGVLNLHPLRWQFRLFLCVLHLFLSQQTYQLHFILSANKTGVNQEQGTYIFSHIYKF